MRPAASAEPWPSTLQPIAETDLDTFDRIQRVNVRGTFIINQLAARQVREGGAIINFSTSITRLQMPTHGAYAGSKGAVEAMTLILARELRGRDVTVNAVAPGPTATPLFFAGKPQRPGLAPSTSLCTRPASCRCRRSRRWTSTRLTASSV